MRAKLEYVGRNPRNRTGEPHTLNRERLDQSIMKTCLSDDNSVSSVQLTTMVVVGLVMDGCVGWCPIRFVEPLTSYDVNVDH